MDMERRHYKSGFLSTEIMLDMTTSEKRSNGEAVTDRNRQLRGYLMPTTLTKVMAVGFLATAFTLEIVACSNSGGTKGSGLFGRWLNAPKTLNSCAVFNAAPMSRTSMTPLKVVFTSRKGPPPYVKTAALKEQFSQSNPSNCCLWAGPKAPSRTNKVWEKTGTTGIWLGRAIASVIGAEPVDEDCAQVDVWIPAEMAKAQEAPTMKDPSASMTLDIVSAPNGCDCSVLRYQTWRIAAVAVYTKESKT